jgi:hypothetical protein
MRILLVAGGVAVAVLVAVVVIGLRLTGDDEPEWSGQATAACEQALGRGRKLAATGAAITPVERRVVEVFAGAAEIEADMLAELSALPRPSADEEEIKRTLTVVAESHQDDLAVLAKLRRTFDRRLFERRVNETIPVLADLRARFTALGATGCVSYYDPNSYATG